MGSQIELTGQTGRPATMILKVSLDEQRRVRAAAATLGVSMSAVLRLGIKTAEAQIAREQHLLERLDGARSGLNE